MIYVTLFVMFFRIGLFSFGGGLAMLPLIFQSVKDFGMMTASEFSDLVALSQVTPGPIAVNAATYVGFNGAGIPGALAATLGVALPSFILILIVVQFLERFQESRGIQGAFLGIRPVTVGLIAAAVLFVGETVLVNGPIISAKLFTALAEKKVNIRMIDQGSSEMNIIVGVENKDFEKAIRAIYGAFVS